MAKVIAADEFGFAAVEYTLIQALTLLANLVAGVIAARALGAEGRIYAAAVLYPTVFGMAAVAGSSDGGLILLRKDPRHARSVVLVMATIAVTLCSVAVLASAFVLPRLLRSHETASAVYVRAALVFTYTTAAVAVLRASFTGLGQFRRSTIAGALPPICSDCGLLLCLFAVLGVLSVGTALASVILGGALAVGIFTPMLIPTIGLGALSPVRDSFRSIANLARRAAPADLLAIAIQWSDRLVLAVFLSAASSGTTWSPSLSRGF